MMAALGSPESQDAKDPDGPSGSDAVVARSVTRRFGERNILNGLDLTIRRSEFVVLLGASGSGKTTLLRLLAGIDQPCEGELWLPESRSVVFQEARLLASQNVWRNVVIGLDKSAGLQERAEAALAEVGIAARAKAWPATLSGGEAQRVALARALVRQPELLLLDEPFASLDALTRLKMQKLVVDLWTSHKPAILMVTHDVDEAILLADRIIVLEGGALCGEYDVDMLRPRASSQQAFTDLRLELLRKLGV